MLKLPFLVTVSLLFSLGTIHAQTPKAPKLSTRDEYRACQKEDDELKKKRSLLTDESETHSANLKRIQDEMQAHVATQAMVNASDETAVVAFNEKIQALNTQVGTSNKEAERLNQEQHRFNAWTAALNQRCAGMVVSYADHEAIRRERAETGKKK